MQATGCQRAGHTQAQGRDSRESLETKGTNNAGSKNERRDLAPHR